MLYITTSFILPNTNMSAESETKHVLDNLFCLDAKDGLHSYLTKQSKLEIAISDIIMIGNKLLSEDSSYLMNND